MAETEIEIGDSQSLKVSKKQNVFEANDDFTRPAYLLLKWKHLEKLPYPEEYKKMTEESPLK